MTADEPSPVQLQMMAFLDDELSPEQRRSFIEECYSDPDLAAELAHYRRLNEIASSMRLREPEDYEFERFFARLTSRIERRLGFFLLGVGVMVLFCAGLHALWITRMPLPFKIGGGLALGGLFLLITSVCRMRLRLARLDRYQGVKR